MMIRRSLKTGSAIGALLITVPALAQVAPATDQAAAQDGLGDIVVTAQKTKQDLQRTPLAVSVIAPEQLAKANIVSLADINGFVPGLTVTRNNGLQRVLSIRGVGYETAQNASSQPGVAFNIDGVYISNNIASGVDLVDLERLEVLRGPQGTVYGQNATGGVINAVTRQPVLGATAFNGDFSYGNYDFIRANAGVNLPIGDTIALRVAGQVLKHDGYAKAPTLDNYQLDNADDTTGKASLLWAPASGFSLIAAVQHYRARSNGPGQKNILDPNPDPRELSQDFRGSTNLTFDLYSLTAHYDAGFADVKLIGAYQRMNSRQQADNDRLNVATLGRYDVYQRSNILNSSKTAEINITSKPDSPVDWILGGFLLRQKTRQFTLEYQGTTTNATYPDITAIPAGGLPSNFAYSTNNRLRRHSYALFGQTTVHLSDALRITGGLRYSNDKFGNVVANNFAAVPVSYSQSSKVVTGKAQAEYDITSDVLGYASYSRGYKPGGVNINTRPILVGRTFRSEHIDAYEIGLKSRLANNRLQLNVAGFYYDYRNFQYQEEDPIPYQGGVANVPKARQYGLEAEAIILLTPALRFTGNGTYLNGTFQSDYFALDALAANQATARGAALGFGAFSPQTINLRAAAVQNVNGNRLPKLPRFAASGALEHRLEFGDGSTLVSRGELVYRGAYQYRIFSAGARDRVPPYVLVNLSFEYKPQGQPFTLGIAATNLFNRDAINARFSDPFGVGATSNTYVAPRQVFATVKVSL